jgi:cytochrome c peroxidase
MATVCGSRLALCAALGGLLLAAAGNVAAGTVPEYKSSPDPSGRIATYNSAGPTPTRTNGFFQALGTNRRACVTCHQARDGWGLSAAHARQRYRTSGGKDPLFRPVDGATCPDDDLSTRTARKSAYALLLSKGLIRIPLEMPAGAQFSVVAVDDPYGCTTLDSPASGVISVYRRPIPPTNLAFASSLMWDGRETSLAQQASDAAQAHEQAPSFLSKATADAIVSFETSLFTAQVHDRHAGNLAAAGATGDPRALAQAEFYIGINDPFGGNPTGAPFDPDVFDTFAAWSGAGGSAATARARASIARGETIFNELPFTISGVRGLNDVLAQTEVTATCSTCHDTPTVGNNSISRAFDIGTSDAANRVLDLPLFTIRCDAGALAGETFQTSDPGLAMTTGQCADIGKLMVPPMRGLAARAPYFHNGSALTLGAMVDFYDERFSIGMTAQQKSDLVAFLGAL